MVVRFKVSYVAIVQASLPTCWAMPGRLPRLASAALAFGVFDLVGYSSRPGFSGSAIQHSFATLAAENRRARRFPRSGLFSLSFRFDASCQAWLARQTVIECPACSGLTQFHSFILIDLLCVWFPQLVWRFGELDVRIFRRACQSSPFRLWNCPGTAPFLHFASLLGVRAKPLHHFPWLGI